MSQEDSLRAWKGNSVSGWWMDEVRKYLNPVSANIYFAPVGADIADESTWTPLGTMAKGSTVDYKATPPQADTKKPFTQRVTEAQNVIADQIQANLAFDGLLQRNEVKRAQVIKNVLAGTRRVVVDKLHLADQLESVGQNADAQSRENSRLRTEIAELTQSRDMISRVAKERETTLKKIREIAGARLLEATLDAVQRIKDATDTGDQAVVKERRAGRGSAALQEIRDAVGAGSGYTSVVAHAKKIVEQYTLLDRGMHKIREYLGLGSGQDVLAAVRKMKQTNDHLTRLSDNRGLRIDELKTTVETLSRELREADNRLATAPVTAHLVAEIQEAQKQLAEATGWHVEGETLKDSVTRLVHQADDRKETIQNLGRDIRKAQATAVDVPRILANLDNAEKNIARASRLARGERG